MRGSRRRPAPAVAERCAATAKMALFYLVGRQVPIPWAVQDLTGPGGSLAAQVAGAWMGQAQVTQSVFALGVGPYMTASILMQLLQLLLRPLVPLVPKERWGRLTRLLAALLALWQAVSRLPQIQLRQTAGVSAQFARFLVVLTLLAGSQVVCFLSERAEEKGIGGMAVLILINILSQMRQSITAVFSAAHVRTRMDALWTAALLLMWFAGTIALTLFLDQSECRLHLYPIGMASPREAESRLPVKVQPCGVMAVMFSVQLYLLPAQLLAAAHRKWPSQPMFAALSGRLGFDSAAGVLAYLALLCLLEVGFSFLVLQPGQLSRDMLEGGDYLAGVRPGRETARALRRAVCTCCAVSCMALSLWVGLPLLYRLAGPMGDVQLYLLPLQWMVLASVGQRVLEQLQVLQELNSYGYCSQ